MLRLGNTLAPASRATASVAELESELEQAREREAQAAAEARRAAAAAERIRARAERDGAGQVAALERDFRAAAEQAEDSGTPAPKLRAGGRLFLYGGTEGGPALLTTLAEQDPGGVGRWLGLVHRAGRVMQWLGDEARLGPEHDLQRRADAAEVASWRRLVGRVRQLAGEEAP